MPIYVQVVDQVQHAVEVGSLEAGDRLPTVRALAKELTVAPNTIVKAYNELQRSGPYREPSRCRNGGRGGCWRAWHVNAG